MFWFFPSATSATGKGAKENTTRVPWRDASAQLGSVPRLAAVLRDTVAPSPTSAATPSDELPYADVADGAAADAQWRWRARGVDRRGPGRVWSDVYLAYWDHLVIPLVTSLLPRWGYVGRIC